MMRAAHYHMCSAGCVITAGILGSGFTQFKSGNRKASQLFMRARVVSQVCCVGMCVSARVRTCIRIHVRVRVCVCVYACERERDRESNRAGQTVCAFVRLLVDACIGPSLSLFHSLSRMLSL